ncbi:MAG: hypothetical protein DMF23_11320 [Verrucomicrobia bacterium]|nr:MAG: hypothetical protein DMF23_11320 [Verrucomicrobiota bacterium]
MKNVRSIIIIGANGRLGAALAREYQRAFSVKAFARSQLDLGKLDQVRSTLSVPQTHRRSLPAHCQARCMLLRDPVAGGLSSAVLSPVQNKARATCADTQARERGRLYPGIGCRSSC